MAVVSPPPPPVSLPVVDAPPPERRDAARNRQRILAAAQELIARDGIDCVTLDRIAEAAGVGKGTLFRRFGDRAGLLGNLLSEREAALQEAMIRGEPPLGPGAPAGERLLAFGSAYLEFLRAQGQLLMAFEATAAGARYANPAYGMHRLHLTLLVRELDPTLDADYVAEVLLGALRADFVHHLLTVRGLTPERIEAGWRTLVERLCGG